MQYKMLFVPARAEEKVRLIESDDEPATLQRLVHGDQYPERNEISFSSIRSAEAQVCYDDLGLWRSNGPLNHRAQQLWAALLRADQASMFPLVGNFVFLGLNPYTGETEDLSPAVQLVADEIFNPRYCPAAQDGGGHHFIPEPRGEANILACVFCGLSQEEARKRE